MADVDMVTKCGHVTMSALNHGLRRGEINLIPGSRDEHCRSFYQLGWALFLFLISRLGGFLVMPSAGSFCNSRTGLLDYHGNFWRIKIHLLLLVSNMLEQVSAVCFRWIRATQEMVGYPALNPFQRRALV